MALPPAVSRRHHTAIRSTLTFLLIATAAIVAPGIGVADAQAAGSPGSPAGPAVGPGVTVEHWGAYFGDKNLGDADRLATPTVVPLPSVPVEVASSNSTEYALMANGTVYAWGQGTNGQLGDGATVNSFTTAVQVQFPAGVHIASIPTDALPYDTALAIDTDGNVWGWGFDAAGELCLGHTGLQTSPVELPLSDVTLAAGAGDHSLFYADGVVEACGGNGYGDLGDGSTAPSQVPVAVAGLTGVTPVALVAAYRNSGVLDSAGAVFDWGYNANGQVGDGDAGVSATRPVQVALPGAVQVLAEGGSIETNGQSLALLSNGGLYAWGADTDGQLGDLGTASEALPIAITPPSGVSYTMLATGAATSYGMTATGAVYAWGLGMNGEIGNGVIGNTWTPYEVISSGATLISATANNVVTADVATSTGTWPEYGYGPTHSSFASGAVAVTPADASHLTKAWDFVPPGAGSNATLISSPTVVDGVVYIGANNGSFYALSEATGAVLWSFHVGRTVASTCGSRGFASTAAVATVNGTETVFVAGPNAPSGYLYALNAATGTVIWQSLIGTQPTGQNSYFDWSSPVVANGDVYVGISSQCDIPLVQAGVLAFSAADGTPVASYYNVPAGQIGGSVWSSPAVGQSGNVFITTGNGPSGNQFLGTSDSVIELTKTLSYVGSWQISPQSAVGDSDFGASPTLFSANIGSSGTSTPMIGACNKNGIFYALVRADLAGGPVWSLTVGAKSTEATGNAECIAPAAWNGTNLFIAGPGTTIGGTAFKGSIREVNPATGAVIWATGLPGTVDGAPSVDGAGVVSVATYDYSGAPNADYLLSAKTGAILATVSTGNSAEFSEPVFVGNMLLLGTASQGLIAYQAGATGS